MELPGSVRSGLQKAWVHDEANYNFTSFERYILFADLKRSIYRDGVRPGQSAPDFELPKAFGGSLQLSELRGKPVVLHFGSYT
jgi:cytochrome oxidase Cu insertion factor (SCO1/SenC/PrrC family)